MTKRESLAAAQAVHDLPPIIPGRYECDGQAPIVVTDSGWNGSTHGPWIYYRHFWESDEAAKPVLFTAFRALQEFGFRRVPDEAEKPQAAKRRKK